MFLRDGNRIGGSRQRIRTEISGVKDCAHFHGHIRFAANVPPPLGLGRVLAEQSSRRPSPSAPCLHPCVRVFPTQSNQCAPQRRFETALSKYHLSQSTPCAVSPPIGVEFHHSFFGFTHSLSCHGLQGNRWRGTRKGRQRNHMDGKDLFDPYLRAIDNA